MTKLSFLLLFSIFIFGGCKKNISALGERESSSAAASKGGQPSSTSIVQWQKCIGTSVNDYGFSLAKTSDGTGYFITGTTETTNRGHDILVAKIDAAGTTVLWQNTFGGTGSDEGTSVVATPDGGCLIAGRTTSNDGDVQGNKGGTDIWLVKLSASGSLDLSQTKTLGGSGYDMTGQIITTVDGGYAIAGQTTSNDGDLLGSGTTKGRGWIIKLDASTNISWQKTLDVSTSKDDVAYGITETSAGRFALTGRTLGFDNNADIWVASFDRNNIYWNRKLGSTGSDVAFEIVGSVNNGIDDGVVITGYLGTEAVAKKIGTDGSDGWQKTFKTGSSLARGRGIVSTATGYVIVGDNTGDMLVWKLAKDGTQLNAATIGGGKNDDGYGVIATDDGKFLSTGSTSSTNSVVSGNHGLSDMWVVKFDF